MTSNSIGSFKKLFQGFPHGEVIGMVDNADPRPAALSEEEIDRLRLIAAHAGDLMAVVQVQGTVLLLSHVLKWLSALVGAMMFIKGFLTW